MSILKQCKVSAFFPITKEKPTFFKKKRFLCVKNGVKPPFSGYKSAFYEIRLVGANHLRAI